MNMLTAPILTTKRWVLSTIVLLLVITTQLTSATHAAIELKQPPATMRLDITPVRAPAYLGYQDILQAMQNPSGPSFNKSQANRYWYIIPIKNTAANTLKAFISNPRLVPISTTIYLLDEKDRIINVINYDTDDYELPQTFTPGLTLPVSLSAGAQHTIMFSVDTAVRPYFPLVLRGEKAFSSHVQQRLLLHGIMAGGLIVLLIYFALSHLYQQTGARLWLAGTCLLLLALLATLQEPVTRWLNFIQFGEYILSGLGLAFLFAMGKFTHSLFSRIPLWLKLINLSLPLVVIFISVYPLSFAPLFIELLCIPVYGALQILLCVLFQDRRNLSLSRLLGVAWLLLSLSWALFLVQFSSIVLPLVSSPASAAAALLSGMCVLAVCVLLAERNMSSQQINTQARAIDDLHVFYHLFKNSAEGLYTSAVDGTLKTINPAMCSLFGYDNEQQMLQEVNDTSDFYADPSQRDVLVGELLENKTVTGREIMGRKADGTQFWFSISCQLHKDSDQTFLSGSIIDVTERKLSDINLNYMATHDSLTGIYNRQEFESALSQALTTLTNDQPLILLYLDLDRFKAVNDTCGHKAGDALIKELAGQLNTVLDRRGTLARLGGDEFGVLMSSQTQESAYELASSMVEAVRDYRFYWENHVFSVGVSIGLLNASQYSCDPAQALFMADAACHLAKQQGRNQVYCYQRNDERLQQYEQELDWVQILNTALQDEGFELFYQHYRPLHSISKGDCYEILLRLRLSDGTLADPASFMPPAERYNLTARLDRYVIQHTFAWLEANPQHLARLQYCNININGQSLVDTDLRRFLLTLFERSKVPGDKICFDISETTAAAHKLPIQEFIDTFRAQGCHFALDNFGSGFSSYACLKALPVQCLKIDGNFVKGLMTDPLDSAIISSFKSIAKAGDITTVALCVEDESTLTQLGRLGIDYAQGNIIAKPQPLCEFKPL